MTTGFHVFLWVVTLIVARLWLGNHFPPGTNHLALESAIWLAFFGIDSVIILICYGVCGEKSLKTYERGLLQDSTS